MAREDTGLSGVAGRYALALLDLADEKRQLDAVAGDLRGLLSTIEGSDDLRRMIRSPLFTRAEQTKAMTAILDKAGVGDMTRRFVLVVAENRRLFVLPQIIKAYVAELSRRRGEVTAEVTSAVQLSEAQQTALVEALRAKVGGKVQIEMKIDKSLIGGLIVKVGSRMIDSSLRSKLQRMQLAMKGVG